MIGFSPKEQRPIHLPSDPVFNSKYRKITHLDTRPCCCRYASYCCSIVSQLVSSCCSWFFCCGWKQTKPQEQEEYYYQRNCNLEVDWESVAFGHDPSVAESDDDITTEQDPSQKRSYYEEGNDILNSPSPQDIWIPSDPQKTSSCLEDPMDSSPHSPRSAL